MKKSTISRRKFIGTAAAAAAFTMVPLSCGNRSKKPNSKVGGVQLGLTTYSYISIPHFNAEEVLGYILQAGVNSVEMRCVLEESLGCPYPLSLDFHNRMELSKEQREEQRQWRLSLPMQKYADLRKMYNDAGVNIHIAKFTPSKWADDEIDYAFNAAKALGAYGVAESFSEENCQRLEKFAAKHKSLAIFHLSGEIEQPGIDINWPDKYFAYSSANRINFDGVNYFASTGLNPIPIIERYHDRICSIHMKDHPGPKGNQRGTFVPFGQGGVPVADILLLLKKEKWPINVDLEMEYTPPEGSDVVKEVIKGIEYMRNILE